MTLRRRVVNASSIVGVAVFVLGCSSGDDATTWVSQASGVLNGGVLNGGVSSVASATGCRFGRCANGTPLPPPAAPPAVP